MAENDSSNRHDFQRAGGEMTLAMMDLSSVGDTSLSQQAFVLAKADSKARRSEQKDSKSDERDSKKVAELLDKIEDTASEHLGDKLWDPDYREVTEDGELGCAVSVSEVLIESGAVGKMGVKESVAALDTALRKKGWTQVPENESIKAGYVMIGYKDGTNWKEGGGNAHVGIVSDLGFIWNNSSRVGLGGIAEPLWDAEPRWIAEPKTIALRPWKYNRTYALKPPGA